MTTTTTPPPPPPPPKPQTNKTTTKTKKTTTKQKQNLKLTPFNCFLISLLEVLQSSISPELNHCSPFLAVRFRRLTLTVDMFIWTLATCYLTTSLSESMKKLTKKKLLDFLVTLSNICEMDSDGLLK